MAVGMDGRTYLVGSRRHEELWRKLSSVGVAFTAWFFP